jgi:peptidoglycan/LPS O-acetylase OafA/YrhL
LLQDVLGIPSLSAGAWYVAIDLQCFALLAALAVWQRRAGRTASAAPGPALLALATTASAVLFNRDPALDMWAVYFLCAYGLGVLAAWSVHDRSARRWLVLTVAVVLVDLAIDPRPRPTLALGTALTLWAVTGRTPSPANLVADVTANATLSVPSWPTARGLVSSLGNVAYGVFVVHFAVIIAVSGLWQLGGWASLESAVGFSALVWVGSLALGTLIHTHVERAPIQRPSPTMH